MQDMDTENAQRTPAELDFIAAMEGVASIDELSDLMGLSAAEVEDAAALIGVSLDPGVRDGMFWCVDCGAWRKMPDCRVCRKREQYERALRRNDILMRSLDMDSRERFAKYADTATDPPKPKRPFTWGMDDRSREQAEASYDSEMEEWEIGHYERLYANAKQQTYRIQEKLRK